MKHFKTQFIFAVSIVSIIISYSYATARPLSPDDKGEIQELFYSGSQLSSQKLNSFKKQLQQRREEFAKNLSRMRTQIDEKDFDKAEKWVQKRKLIKAFDLAIHWTEATLQNPNDQHAFSQLEMALRLSEVLKVNIESIKDWAYIRKLVSTRLQNFSVGGPQNKSKNEATNLYDPSTKSFYSQSDLERMKSQGFDISRLNPPPDNGVIDLSAAGNQILPNKTGLIETSLYKNSKVRFPEKASGNFVEMIKSQTKPKMKIQLNDGSGDEIKLKIGREIRAETTASLLAEMLGLHQDQMKRYSSCHVNLGKLSLDEFKREWNEYFESTNPEDFISRSGKNEKGETFAEFTDCLLEFREAKDLNRVASWQFENEHLRSRREFRGLILFQAWLQNSDLKNENTKLVIKENDDSSLYYTVHDMGFSFGGITGESPLDYEANPIKSANSDKITFDFFPKAYLGHITYADARWMIRKIATLSRTQIEAAVQAGQWHNKAPHNFEDLIIERLIQRRNAMAKAFGLINTSDEIGQNITLLPTREIPKSEVLPLKGVSRDVVDYGPELLTRFVYPGIRKLANMTWDLSLQLIGGSDKLAVEPAWFGIDNGLITQVIVNLDRKFIRNPEPISSEDTYIVKDDYKISLRLGAGFVVSGDVALVTHHTLVFPASSESRARFAPAFRIHMLESYEQLAKRLPKDHVYIRDEYLEGRGRIKFQAGEGLAVGISGSQSIIRLYRGAVVTKNGIPQTVWLDQEKALKTAISLYTKIIFVSFPNAELVFKVGQTNRHLYDLNKFSLKKKFALTQEALAFGSNTQLENQGASRIEVRKFTGRESKWNLLGILYGSKKQLKESIQAYGVDSKGKTYPIEELIKFHLTGESGWSFLTDGEKYGRDFNWTSTNNGNTTSQIVDLRLAISDKNVKTKEFADQYLSAIDIMSGENDFLKFTPRLHAGNNNIWGPLDVYMRVSYSNKALDKIATLTRDHLLSAFARETKTDWNTVSRWYQLSIRKLASGISGNKGPQVKTSPLAGVDVTIYGHSIPVRESMKMINDFGNVLANAVKEVSASERSSRIIKGLFEASKKSNGFLNPIIFSLVNSYVKLTERYFSVFIAPEQFFENKLPEELVFVRSKGTFDKAYAQDKSLYEFDDALRVYQSLVMQVDQLSPMRPLK